ncbi:interleukin-8-like [Scyliorhinus canicula]|uniref:interleukin-8-like n=1 Tax=Scyliorhinus canicula TaxID=7830 RepID=UPI0018F67DBE|nr:interleukin-8-like [Scyliorhinus canicula]
MISKVTLTILILFALYMVPKQAGATGMNLRCNCIKIHSTPIHPKFIQDLKIFESGPHCPNVEIIVSVKGHKVCLNPKAPWVKMIVKRYFKKQANFSEEEVNV